MSGITLVNELNELQGQLVQGVKIMADYGRTLAKAEYDYKVALAEQSLRLRDEGMAVTLIDKVVYGKVAKERMHRDVAEVMYKTALEHINATKLRLRLVQAQIEKEWSNE